jgi:outer membrane lipoprotein-sorting protein
MNKRWFIGLGVLVAISLLLVGCQGGPTAEEIVAKMKEIEAGTEDAHAILEMSFEGQGRDEELVIEVWEKKPNKFRAEVLEASGSEVVAGSIIVSDGSQTWIYDPGQNEVLVGDVGPDEPSGPRDIIRFIDEVIQQVLDTTEVKLVGEEAVAGLATYKLEFTPKDDEETGLPPGSKATLWVEQERWIVLQAHFSGAALGEGWMRVRSFELNAGLTDDLFQFKVPEGAQVTNIEDKRPTPTTLDEAQAQADFNLLVPNYLPEGVTLIDVLAVDEAFILRYDHSETSFTIVQGFVSGRNSPPPGSQKTEVTVRGQTANLITDGLGNNFLAWTENGVTITVAGRISQDEMLKVAESLQ